MQRINEEKIIKSIKAQLKNFNPDLGPIEIGQIIEIKDGIATVSGMQSAQNYELVICKEDNYGIVLNLEEDVVQIAVFGQWKHLRAGEIVKRTKKMIHIPVGPNLLGRVVNALGTPIDQLGEIKITDYIPLERPAPGVLDRLAVNQPFFTGIKAIDTMIPIGKGQRELIIGDRQTGKTTLAIDAIIAQKNTGIKCIYLLDKKILQSSH